MRKTGFLIAAAVLAGGLPVSAHAQRYTLRCESNDGRRHECRADVSGGASVQRRLSDAPCREGYSWGTTRRGIWVDNGCRAEFSLGSNGGYGRGGNDGYGGYDRGNDGYGRGNDDYDRDRDDRYDRDRDDDRYDRNDRGWGNSRRWTARAEAQCRRAVAQRLRYSSNRVNTWVERARRDRIEIGWRAGNSRRGSCDVDSRGRTRIHVNGGGILDVLRGW
jgi:hypothetical protein